MLEACGNLCLNNLEGGYIDNDYVFSEICKKGAMDMQYSLIENGVSMKF